MRLEEQRPPELQVWPYLVRVINGGLDWSNFAGKRTSGTTPFVVPGLSGGGLVLKQDRAGTVFFMDHADGLQVDSSPPGILVQVIVW